MIFNISAVNLEVHFLENTFFVERIHPLTYVAHGLLNHALRIAEGFLLVSPVVNKKWSGFFACLSCG